MAQLQFNDENNIRGRKSTPKKGFADRLISWGVVKNESQANVILIVLIVIGLGITIYNVISISKPPATTTFDPLTGIPI